MFQRYCFQGLEARNSILLPGGKDDSLTCHRCNSRQSNTFWSELLLDTGMRSALSPFRTRKAMAVVSSPIFDECMTKPPVPPIPIKVSAETMIGRFAFFARIVRA